MDLKRQMPLWTLALVIRKMQVACESLLICLSVSGSQGKGSQNLNQYGMTIITETKSDRQSYTVERSVTKKNNTFD